MQVFRAFSFLVFKNYILDTKTLIRIILAEVKHFLKAERKVLKKTDRTITEFNPSPFSSLPRKLGTTFADRTAADACEEEPLEVIQDAASL